MAKITLSGVVKALGLGRSGAPNCTDPEELVPTDVVDVTIMCPCCAPRHNNRRATLNLNFQKGLFNCMRCHFSGKATDLVAYYTGWEQGDVEKRIQAGELGDVKIVSSEAEAALDEPSKDIAPLKQRHEVYGAMLSLLSLSDTHKDELIRRGLTEEEIIRNGYKSTPVFMGVKAVPQRLGTMGFDLRNVPGFGLNKAGDWEMSRTTSGFFVPGRNAMHLLQGFQIRADHPTYSTPKYGYFSSRSMPGGAACETWPHWAGPNIGQLATKEKFDIFVVEGWLKGDICHAKTGQNFLCVPGVTALKKLFPALASFRKENLLRNVYIAYDMDAYDNPDVAKQLIGLFYRLVDEGYPVKILEWEKEFKGLDDWLTGIA